MAELSAVILVVFTVAYLMVALVGICGNFFVIYVICSDRKFRRSAMNVILVNLAVADLLNVLSCIPDLYYALYTEGYFLLGLTMCKILRYTQNFSILSSVLLQVTVCLERFFAICYPMVTRVHQSWAKVSIALVTAWTIGLLFAVPHFSLQTGYKPNASNLEDDGIICGPPPRPPNWHVYSQFAELIIFYVIPGLLFVIVYSVISATLWKASRAAEMDGFPREVRISLASAEGQNPNSIIQKRLKVIRTLVACVLTYIVCYTPTNFLFLYHKLAAGPAMRGSFAVNMTFNWLTYLSAAANPVIYVICMPVFRQKLADLVHCRKKADPNASYVTANAYWRNAKSSHLHDPTVLLGSHVSNDAEADSSV